jgi:uncharacterized protein YdhG (YjbR/CyaY superfamily)
VPANSGDRSAYFPAIEKKHGQPVKFYLAQLKELGAAKYPEQIAFLRENHGFSQAHANAVVMYARGSTTSKRHKDPADYLAKLDKTSAKTVKTIIKEIQTKFPKLELVIAWNQPMFKRDKAYVFGLGVQKNHILLNPFSEAALAKVLPKLKNYEVNKHTIRVPLDWQVDSKLLIAIVKARLSEL